MAISLGILTQHFQVQTQILTKYQPYINHTLTISNHYAVSHSECDKPTRLDVDKFQPAKNSKVADGHGGIVPPEPIIS